MVLRETDIKELKNGIISKKSERGSDEIHVLRDAYQSVLLMGYLVASLFEPGHGWTTIALKLCNNEFPGLYDCDVRQGIRTMLSGRGRNCTI